MLGKGNSLDTEIREIVDLGSTKVIFKHSDWLTRSLRPILPGEWQGPTLGDCSCWLSDLSSLSAALLQLVQLAITLSLRAPFTRFRGISTFPNF